MRSNGQAAHDKWSEIVYDYHWPWEEIPQEAREGWEKVAKAVLDNDQNREGECGHIS